MDFVRTSSHRGCETDPQFLARPRPLSGIEQRHLSDRHGGEAADSFAMTLAWCGMPIDGLEAERTFYLRELFFLEIWRCLARDGSFDETALSEENLELRLRRPFRFERDMTRPSRRTFARRKAQSRATGAQKTFKLRSRKMARRFSSDSAVAVAAKNGFTLGAADKKVIA